MGKTRTKLIDASQPETLSKKEKKAKHKSNIASKTKELDKTHKVEEVGQNNVAEEVIKARGDNEEGSHRVAAANKISEVFDHETSDRRDARRDTEPAGPRLEKKNQKQIQTRLRGKKYQEAKNKLDRSRSYTLDDAIELAKKSSYSKFTGSLEAHINTIQTGLRGLVSLPYSSGKKLRILAFGTTGSAQVKELEQIDGVKVGDDSTIEEISKGKIDFDMVITSPTWMPKLAKVAKYLGPKGLMPNPKNGTITEDLKRVAESFQSGRTEYKTEAKAPIIHLALGKLDQPTDQLSANIKTLIMTLGKTRIKKISLSPTMGPSIKVDLNKI